MSRCTVLGAAASVVAVVHHKAQTFPGRLQHCAFELKLHETFSKIDSARNR